MLYLPMRSTNATAQRRSMAKGTRPAAARPEAPAHAPLSLNHSGGEAEELARKAERGPRESMREPCPPQASKGGPRHTADRAKATAWYTETAARNSTASGCPLWGFGGTVLERAGQSERRRYR
jgi:hypothetical protein